MQLLEGWRPLSLAVIAIFLGSTGQFLFRLGMLQYGEVTTFSLWKNFWQIIFTAPIMLGFMLFGFSSVLWLVVISRWELSYAYPLVALGYLMVIFYGTVFLHETLTMPKIVGSILILIGISILGLF